MWFDMSASRAIDASLVSSKISVPALCALAILMPLAPAVIVPKPANLVAGAVVAALLVVPVVVLRRRRWVPRLGAALLALLAVAVVLTVLGRVVHQKGRRELRPLRWRWPLVFWGVALVLVSIPQAMVWSSLADGPAEYSIMVMDGGCFGGMEEILLGHLAAVLILIPQPIVLGVGFGFWALLALTGRRPLGRVVGWLTLVPLVLRDLMMNWMPVLGCAQSSDEATHPVTIAWVLVTLLPIVLVLLAVRVRRAAAPTEEQPV
ncbi:hypothetical protein ABZW11_17530 [Nonomuraea sp. NPDC004580]|uniref:hypothetical protein n=1 Tax=Nonomuraea sp. NPDC004580 TaxID=3154552 RepID=UPI0033AD069C